MRDYRKYVQRRLEAMSLPVEERRAVVEEIAAHLEESFLAFRLHGVSESDAHARTLQLAGDWGTLCLGVVSAKREESMQNRVKQFWVPGLVTLLLSALFLMVLQRTAYQPRIYSWSQPGTIILYVPWVLCLPVTGALGAYLSRRVEGRGLATWLSSVFPAAAILTFFLALFPLAFLIDRQVSLQIKTVSLVANLVSWVLIPAVALLAGGATVTVVSGRARGDAW
jgi:hypothetical protein